MRWSIALAGLLFAASALAGCTGSAKGTSTGTTDDLHATPTTGVLHGVIVDDAIRPLANVSVMVRQGSIQRNATTGVEGRFGFQDLPPGSYTVQAHRNRYTSAQQVVAVQAGVDDPPQVKLQLTFLASQAAFYSEYKLNGFIECTTPNVNACFIADYYPCFAQRTAGQQCSGNLTSDHSSVTLYSVMDLKRVPDWTQAEMVWTPTNAAFTQLTLRLDIQTPGNVTYDASNITSGDSPLSVVANRTFAQENGLGMTHGLVFETFGQGNPATCGLGVPYGLGCSPAATVNQDVTFYVHVFYGYRPPPGWSFAATGQVPAPPN